MITLKPENSNAIVKLAALIGWTPDRLLAETLETFADQNSGALEGSSARSTTPTVKAHNAHRIG